MSEQFLFYQHWCWLVQYDEQVEFGSYMILFFTVRVIHPKQNRTAIGHRPSASDPPSGCRSNFGIHLVRKRRFFASQLFSSLAVGFQRYMQLHIYIYVYIYNMHITHRVAFQFIHADFPKPPNLPINLIPMKFATSPEIRSSSRVIEIKALNVWSQSWQQQVEALEVSGDRKLIWVH